MNIFKQNRMKSTNMEKYGCENVFQNEDVKEKIKKIMLDKYGYDHNMKDPKMIERVKKTNIKLYNYVYKFRDPEIIQKGRDTCKEKYGVEFPLQNKEINQKGFDTIFKKYGVNAPMQHPEFLEKQLKSRFKRKEFIFPKTGRIVHVLGYEHLALAKLLEMGIEENDIVVNMLKIPKIKYKRFENDHDAVYFPDIYIKSLNKIIEVKSDYIYKIDQENNDRKWIETAKLYDFEVFMYMGPQRILEVYRIENDKPVRVDLNKN